jgi:hypothetical protein
MMVILAVLVAATLIAWTLHVHDDVRRQRADARLIQDLANMVEYGGLPDADALAEIDRLRRVNHALRYQVQDLGRAQQQANWEYHDKLKEIRHARLIGTQQQALARAVAAKLRRKLVAVEDIVRMWRDAAIRAQKEIQALRTAGAQQPLNLAGMSDAQLHALAHTLQAEIMQRPGFVGHYAERHA